MKIGLLIVLLVAMLALPASALADGCVPDFIQLTGAGTATPGFEPGSGIISVGFSGIDELVFLFIESDGEQDILYQGADGFAAVIYAEDLDYTYYAGGYACAMAYHAYLPLVIDE